MEIGIGFILIKPAAIERSLDSYILAQVKKSHLSVMRVRLMLDRDSEAVALYIAGADALNHCKEIWWGLRNKIHREHAHNGFRSIVGLVHTSRNLTELQKDVEEYLPGFAHEVKRIID